jgi:hypothetical protein
MSINIDMSMSMIKDINMNMTMNIIMNINMNVTTCMNMDIGISREYAESQNDMCLDMY